MAKVAFTSKCSSTLPHHPHQQGVLSCPGADRLQTGMCGASGKPQGTVARVHVGQVTMSICTKLQNKKHVIEALRRAKFKVPGRQKVPRSGDLQSLMWINLETRKCGGRRVVLPLWLGVRYTPSRGPLDRGQALYA